MDDGLLGILHQQSQQVVAPELLKQVQMQINSKDFDPRAFPKLVFLQIELQLVFLFLELQPFSLPPISVFLQRFSRHLLLMFKCQTPPFRDAAKLSNHCPEAHLRMLEVEADLLLLFLHPQSEQFQW